MPRRECYSATHLPASPPPFPHAEKWETGVISLSCLVGPGWGGRVLPTPQVGGGSSKFWGLFSGEGATWRSRSEAGAQPPGPVEAMPTSDSRVDYVEPDFKRVPRLPRGRASRLCPGRLRSAKPVAPGLRMCDREGRGRVCMWMMCGGTVMGYCVWSHVKGLPCGPMSMFGVAKDAGVGLRVRKGTRTLGGGG